MKIKNCLIFAFLLAVFAAGFACAFDSLVEGVPWNDTSYISKVVMQNGDLYKFSYGKKQYNLVMFSISGDKASFMITPGTWRKAISLGRGEEVDLDGNGKNDVGVNITSIEKTDVTILFTQLDLVPIPEQPAPVSAVNNSAESVSLNESIQNDSTDSSSVTGSVVEGPEGEISYTTIIFAAVGIIVLLIVGFIFIRSKNKFPQPQHKFD